MRPLQKLMAIGAVAAVVLALLFSLAVAREQDGDAGQCWDPDIEFPVPCDEDEE